MIGKTIPTLQNHKDNGGGGSATNSMVEKDAGNQMLEDERVKRHWTDNCMVVEAIASLDERELKKTLNDKGIKEVKIAKLTEESWVLEFQNDKEKSLMMQEDMGWTKEIFSVVKPWNKRDINGKRRVWIGGVRCSLARMDKRILYINRENCGEGD